MPPRQTLWQKSGSQGEDCATAIFCKPFSRAFSSFLFNGIRLLVDIRWFFKHLQLVKTPTIYCTHRLPICRPGGPRQILLPNDCWPVGRMESPDIRPMQPGSTPHYARCALRGSGCSPWNQGQFPAMDGFKGKNPTRKSGFLPQNMCVCCRVS